MKAFRFYKYGKPEKVLTMEEVPRPSPSRHEVLVRIHATAVNDYDWAMLRGKPVLYRLMFGLFKPGARIPGMELAGIVEELGPEVSDFRKGDKVFGDISDHGFGSFAEYFCIHEKALRIKPAEIAFNEACALPHAALLALQGLRDMGKLREGEKVLINGGGGGVGSFAVQLAKLYQCEVTGVDSEEKFKTMKTLGFDHVLDYRKVNFTKTGEKYDLILDCKTGKPALSYLKALKPGGRYVTVGGKVLSLLRLSLTGLITNRLLAKKLKILALKPNKDLEFITGLCLTKKLNILLDGPHAFEKLPEAVRYFGEARHKGKVVISIFKP